MRMGAHGAGHMVRTCRSVVLCVAALLPASAPARAAVDGWLHWRGPDQNGTSSERGLPDRLRPASASAGGVNHLWSVDLAGRGTPVIARYGNGPADDRVFAWGYRGEGADLVEVLACLEADSGRTVWEHIYADFLSDIIYSRYSIGSPTVDPETGHVYLMTSPGLLVALDRDGRPLWEVSMMERYGRLTFPNGRTGAPSIEGDLVIVNAISTNWGREGPARNRFYAFDKRSGELVWSSTPGVGPPFLKDSSFCAPLFADLGGRRVFYAGTGCGNVVCVDARTGDPLWRYQLAVGGVNSAVALYGDTVIAVHGKENPDDSGRGRMVALRTSLPEADAAAPAVFGAAHEAWRNDAVSMFTSSPALVGDRVYQTTMKGDLVCVDARSGRTLWSKKLGTDQLHASPLHVDGRLYVPMWHDGLYVLKPTDTGAEQLDHVELEGLCIGSPSVWNGRIYVHTTERLYCFGRRGTALGGLIEGAGSRLLAIGGEGVRALAAPLAAAGATSAPRRLQVVPAEVLLRPGGEQPLRLRSLDADGATTDTSDGRDADWQPYVPPTARVKAKLAARFDAGRGLLVAEADAGISAGAFTARLGDAAGTLRGRVLPSPPYAEDFESFTLSARTKDDKPFAYPPLAWIGARLKWEVHDLGSGGGKVLAKTLDRVLFQRSMVFLGHPDEHDYTVVADVMSDGNRRTMSSGGVINQRYVVALVGNAQILEIVSNHDRVKASVPFTWAPKRWYRLMARVDADADGGGVVRAKAWPRDEPEPDQWTIVVPHGHAHRHGAPGLYGFSPQSRFRVYLDNVKVVTNDG